MLATLVHQRSAEILPAVIAFRQHLHRFPELSFAETQTATFVEAQLQALGIPFQRLADTGVVGLIRGERMGDGVVALRADMDALPIQEASAVPYASQNPGVMHACGHDVHTAALLGAAQILQELRPHFGGQVKLLFQPGEERLPGGASLLIAAGALENPAPQQIFGQHVFPSLDSGKVGFRAGPYMGSCDELFITVHGRGGHGAMPHECIDPVLISAHLIVALQQIVSRNNDPTLPTVLSIGKVQSAGGATNIIPDSVYLEGTFRTMNEAWRREAHTRMQDLAHQLVRSMGGRLDFDLAVGYPNLQNDEQLTAAARTWASEYLGPDQMVELPIRLTAEDFAYYSQVIPACFYRLGTGGPGALHRTPVHTNTFDIDEQALETGVGLMAWLALRQLGGA